MKESVFHNKKNEKWRRFKKVLVGWLVRNMGLRAAHLEPPRVRWKNDQVCLTSLRTSGATVQWKVNISGAWKQGGLCVQMPALPLGSSNFVAQSRTFSWPWWPGLFRASKNSEDHSLLLPTDTDHSMAANTAPIFLVWVIAWVKSAIFHGASVKRGSRLACPPQASATSTLSNTWSDNNFTSPSGHIMSPWQKACMLARDRRRLQSDFPSRTGEFDWLSSHSKLRARHRNIVLCLLLLSARCVAFHLCPEGQPAGANLNRRSVATDKVRGYLVQPFSSASTSVLIVLAISRITSTPAEHDSGTSIHIAREISTRTQPCKCPWLRGKCNCNWPLCKSRSSRRKQIHCSWDHRYKRNRQWTIHELLFAQSQ